MTRTMLVTGASSGIGAAVARAALDAGWRVGLFARRRDRLEALAEGRDALVLPGDVTDPRAIEAAVASLAERWGRLDVLFNNAGMFGPQATIDEVSTADWQAVLAVNVGGMFNAARAAFAQMRRQSPQGGRIINNGSLSAHSPRPGSVCYTTTKHAVTGLTRTLSLDGRAFDIACGQIDIGNARTELVDDLNARALAADPAADLMPMMDVADAARSVLHMADMPPDANVQFLTVLATKMPFVGRG